MNQITVKNVVNDLKLEVIYGNSFLDYPVVKSTSSRPSVEIYSGYFDYFEYERIQVIGTKELTLFNMLSSSLKTERLEKMFKYNSPAYVFTKNVDAPKEFVEFAIKYQKPLLKSKSSTSGFIGELTNYLQSVLAPREVINGSMMEIFGIGVLITGVDGIGKSETVLKLIKNGHIMVSDDLTQIYQVEFINKEINEQHNERYYNLSEYKHEKLAYWKFTLFHNIHLFILHSLDYMLHLLLQTTNHQESFHLSFLFLLLLSY